MHRIDDPVDAGVVSDSVVSRIDQNNLIKFVCAVLAHPVAVEHSKPSNFPTNAFFRNGPEIPCRLELIDTHGSGLASDDALGNGSLATSSTDSNSVDHVPILGLIAEFASLIGTRRTAGPVDDGQLPELPSPDSQNEVHDIGLLTPPEFFQVFVGAHLWCIKLILFNIFLNQAVL